MEFLKTLLSGAVGAGLVAGLFTLFGKGMDNHHEDRKNKMTESKQLRTDVSNLQKDVNNMKKRFDSLDAADRALMKAVSALLLHNMSGNATGKMEKAHQELTDFIIEHGGE